MIGNKEQMHDGPAVRKERKFRALWELDLELRSEGVTCDIVFIFSSHICDK
jgi:hypothetical protein